MIESVGTDFNESKLELASLKTREVIAEAASRLTPGMAELEARALVQQLQAAHGAPKSWHPLQIRFGSSTLLPFGAKGIENPALGANDILSLEGADGHRVADFPHAARARASVSARTEVPLANRWILEI